MDTNKPVGANEIKKFSSVFGREKPETKKTSSVKGLEAHDFNSEVNKISK